MAFQWCIWFRKLSTLAVFMVLIDGALSVDDHSEDVYMCDSQIYCQGPILLAVNRLHVYNDSKHYVDMPLRLSVDETLAAFHKRFPIESEITKEALLEFLEEYFIEPGGELRNCVPSDWKAEPDSFKFIKDPKYRQWAIDLQAIWLKLCRQMNDSVLKDYTKNSLIFVPNIFIAPGGRFREYYYWDTYWIIRGLLMSQMYETAKGIIRNFAFVINGMGFIPNGGRRYYSLRSQPPFFIPMVYEYYMETYDLELVREVMPSMEKELEWWHANRTYVMQQNDKNYTLYHYLTPSNTPRPESYKEDQKLAISLKDPAQKRQMYQDIATAAESGLDFGSRYFRNRTEMISIRTSKVLSVDLNAVMCWNYHIMHLLNLNLGDNKKARQHLLQWDELRDSLNDVFYDSINGSWFDIDLETRKHIKEFYPSNAVPLFTGCYDTLDTTKPRKLYDYFKRTGALDFPSGIPSSMIGTSQQWDLPNGWPPHNHMVIEGFRKSGHEEIQEDAFQIASKWLRVNYLVFQKMGHMYEKYNVSDTTYQPGGGGEYEVQVGFGWSNGVVLDLLRTYGSRLVAPDESGHTAAQTTSAAPNDHSVPSMWLITSSLWSLLYTVAAQW